MLLRRMIEHVRDQNWFAVALDFVIVVSGVALAFQLTTWAEDRKTQEDVANTLLRMHEESVEVVRYLDGQVANFTFLTGMQDRTVGALYAGDVEELDERTAQIGIFSMRFYPETTPPRAVYGEMSATGMFTRIEDGPTRQDIISYYQGLDFYQGQLNFFRQAILSSELVETDGVTTFYDPEADERIGLSINLPVIAEDEAYINNLVEQLRNQLVIHRYRTELRDAAVAMCETLAENVDSTCPRTDYSAAPPGAQSPTQHEE